MMAEDSSGIGIQHYAGAIVIGCIFMLVALRKGLASLVPG